jgi:hypothetical protein
MLIELLVKLVNISILSSYVLIIMYFECSQNVDNIDIVSDHKIEDVNLLLFDN